MFNGVQEHMFLKSEIIVEMKPINVFIIHCVELFGLCMTYCMDDVIVVITTNVVILISVVKINSKHHEISHKPYLDSSKKYEMYGKVYKYF